MTEVVEIFEHGKGRFLIHYRVHSPCMCSHTRHTKMVKAETKPTVKEAEKLIYEA